MFCIRRQPALRLHCPCLREARRLHSACTALASMIVIRLHCCTLPACILPAFCLRSACVLAFCLAYWRLFCGVSNHHMAVHHPLRDFGQSIGRNMDLGIGSKRRAPPPTSALGRTGSRRTARKICRRTLICLLFRRVNYNSLQCHLTTFLNFK